MSGGWDAWYEAAVADGGIAVVVDPTGASPGVPLTPPNCLEVGGAGTGGSGCDVVMWHEGATAVASNPGLYNTGPNQPFPTGTWPQASTHAGTWVYKAWNYCPNSFPTGMDSHYFIVNDVHNNTAIQ